MMICACMAVVVGCSQEALDNAGTADSSSPAGQLTISAAASLTDALTEIQQSYEEQNENITIYLNFGGSGTLQRQIEQGAPADLFLSASPRNMQALVDQQLIDTERERTLLTNELVVIVPQDDESAWENIDALMREEIRHVAIGIPESVPAGHYAKEALVHADLWDDLSAKMVQAQDVRQVLQYVETGNADAGFVYRTDARTSQQVKVAFTVDANTYTPVEYPVGILKSAANRQEAEDFYSYLQTEQALDVFEKYGFAIPK